MSRNGPSGAIGTGDAPDRRLFHSGPSGLVTCRCDLDGLEDAFAAIHARRGLKTVLVP